MNTPFSRMKAHDNPDRLAGFNVQPLMIWQVVLVSLILWSGNMHAAQTRVSYPCPEGMTRADVIFVDTVENPKGVLVLCPGANGDGSGMVGRKEWIDFAKKENLGLAGIHFQSPIELLQECRGYYQAKQGSGEILLEAIRERYGKELPLLLFGFSGGAHFTTRFVAWRPERVQGWCALGAGMLESPLAETEKTFGMMACGSEDPRLGGALMFFKQGRAAGNPWLWACLPETGHALPPKFEAFTRQYFAALLSGKVKTGVWVDIDSGKEIEKNQVEFWPSLSGWMPDRALLDQWRKAHEIYF